MSAQRIESTQQGAATLLVVLLLAALVFTVLLFALRAGQASIHSTLAGQDSIEALFLAESGLEQVAQLLGNGTTCSAALMTTHTMGGGGFTISSIATTNFDGATALAANQCRVQVTGTINNSHARRIIEAIIIAGSSGGGALRDGGFSNPAAWDKPVLVSGGALHITSTSDNEQVASIPKGLVTISPAPGSVLIAVQFNYVIIGSVNVQIRIDRSSGGPINVNNGLSGSGSFSDLAIGTFDPNTITNITIKITGISAGETITVDNLYVGPSSGAGSGVTKIASWRETP